MIWALSFAVWCCLFAGVYLLVSRDLLRIFMGLVILGSGANLLLFATGRIGSMTPPLIESGATTLSATAANPLPQALVLTAIVIGFALACFSIVLLLAVSAALRNEDQSSMRVAEPATTDGNYPAIDQADETVIARTQKDEAGP